MELLEFNYRSPRQAILMKKIKEQRMKIKALAEDENKSRQRVVELRNELWSLQDELDALRDGEV